MLSSCREGIVRQLGARQQLRARIALRQRQQPSKRSCIAMWVSVSVVAVAEIGSIMLSVSIYVMPKPRAVGPLNKCAHVCQSPRGFFCKQARANVKRALVDHGFGWRKNDSVVEISFGCFLHANGGAVLRHKIH